MSRRTWAAAAVMAAALAIVGCSAGAAPGGRGSPSPGAGTASPTVPGSPNAGTGIPSTSTSGRPGTAASTPPVSPTAGATVANNDFRLEIDAPSCARQGGVLPVTIRTEPEADVALIIAFSDGDAHEAYKLGTANKQGEFSSQLPIPPAAPRGPAKLLATVGKELKGNTGEKPFTVVGTTERCP